jgi:hypothetical protein
MTFRITSKLDGIEFQRITYYDISNYVEISQLVHEEVTNWSVFSLLQMTVRLVIRQIFNRRNYTFQKAGDEVFHGKLSMHMLLHYSTISRIQSAYPDTLV